MKEKLTTIEELAATVEDGMTIGIGGSTSCRHPMALLRELVRQGRKDLTVQTWLGGLDVDFLAGAGAVRRLECAYVGPGPLGLAPHVRRLADRGDLEVHFFTESSMIARFRAAAAGQPFGTTRVMAGTDFTNSDLVREITCPFLRRHTPRRRPRATSGHAAARLLRRRVRKRAASHPLQP